MSTDAARCLRDVSEYGEVLQNGFLFFADFFLQKGDVKSSVMCFLFIITIKLTSQNRQ